MPNRFRDLPNNFALLAGIALCATSLYVWGGLPLLSFISGSILILGAVFSALR